jgi:hypothetical protein
MKLIFISLFVIFYFLIKEFLIKRFTYSNPFSNYENFENLSNTIFINNKSKYNNYKIKKQTLFDDTFTPILLTDYRYSEVFKLGYELKKLCPLTIRTSEGMYSNLSELVKEDNSYQMAFCTENDYYKAINDKVIKKEDVNFVCSFYRLEFILILNAKFRIQNYNELLMLISKKSKENKNDYLKIGLLDVNHSSHHDGIELLKLLKITKDTKGITIIDNFKSMRDLIEAFDNNELDMVYLTTTSKNPYLINFLKTNFINIIGTDGINNNLIKIKFPNVFRDIINISKYNRILEDTADLLSFSSSRDLGKKTKINTYSTRLFLVAKKTLPEEYVLKLLRNIYGSLTKLKKSMNDYFLNERNNTLNKSFDPHEMFFIKKNLQYHKGAKKFYEEINFINYSNLERPFDENIRSKLLTEIVSSNELQSIKKYDV